MKKSVSIGMSEKEHAFFSAIAERKGYKSLSAMLRVALYQFVIRHPAKGLEIEKHLEVHVEDKNSRAVLPGGIEEEK